MFWSGPGPYQGQHWTRLTIVHKKMLYRLCLFMMQMCLSVSNQMTHIFGNNQRPLVIGRNLYFYIAKGQIVDMTEV